MSIDLNPYASPTAAAAAPYFSSIDETAEVSLATRGERFLGALIDALIMMPISFVFGFGLGIAVFASGISPDSMTFQVLTTIGGLLIGAGLFVAVNGYLLAKRGQTVGKYVMNTQIRSEYNDQLLPLSELIGKRYVPLWIASVLPVVSMIYPIANALAIFRSNHKCFHDDLAGTKVVKLAK